MATPPFRQQPSIRAASWCAAQCVRRFATDRGLSHPDLDEFCRHLENLAAAQSVTAWEAGGSHLRLTGLGDPLPEDLAAIRGLADVIGAAREVSASQLWGAWQPADVNRFLAESARAACLEPAKVFACARKLQEADTEGWGPAVSEQELAQWSFDA